jgi:DNA-binding NarL/FixJ family response regulator
MQKNYLNQKDQRQVFICDQQAIYAMGCGELAKAHPMCNGYQILKSLDEISSFNFGVSQGLLIIDCAMFDFDSQAVKKKIKALQQVYPCIILLNKDTPDFVLYQLIELEVDVIVSRNMSSLEWNKAVEMACHHKVYFCQDTAERVLQLTQAMDKINLIERVNALSLYDKYSHLRRSFK